MALACSSVVASAAHAEEPPTPVPTTATADPLDTSDAEAEVPDVTTPDPSEPQCMGVRYDTRPDDEQAAAEIMDGKLTLPTFGTWTLPENPTWKEDPFRNASWVFKLQNLRWTEPLRREWLRTGNEAMRDRYVAIWKDWIQDNPRSAPASSYSWYDMAVGLRGVGLTCLSTALDGEPEWFTQAVDAHAAALSDPKLYRFTGNHALHQNMGLMALGCSRDVPTWRDLAAQRSRDLLGRSVDAQGVTDEGSVLYQYLNYLWYNELRRRLQLCHLPVDDDLFARVDRMPEFLADATQPDGTWVPWGDTSAVEPAQVVEDTPQEYALTQGADGPAPKNTLALYTNRGYAFSRSGWFDTQTADQQSLLSVKFGPSQKTQVHGHQDGSAVGFFALGKQLLWQPGLWGGAGGPQRSYVLSNEAHNVIDVPGTSFSNTGTTKLSVTRSTADADLFSLKSSVLRGVTWKRTVVHAKKAGFIVVDDRVTQSTSRSVVQRWQLEADRKISVSTRRAASSGKGANATIMWIATTPNLSKVAGRRSPSYLGWRSPVINTFTPSPVVSASRSGKNVRITAVIVPRASSTTSTKVKIVRSKVAGSSTQADVATGHGTWRITWTSSSVSVRKL